MPIASGRSSPAKALSTIDAVGPLTLPRLGVLMCLGALTVVLHQSFNYPLKMPGHHGLEAMFILVIGRLLCTHRWSATIVALSTATTAQMIGAEHQLATALLDLAPGIVLDLAVLLIPNWRAQLFVLPFAVAIAHATKPLVRYGLFETLGIPFGSLRHGLFYPLSTHFVYGLTGGIIAVLVWRATVRRLRQQ